MRVAIDISALAEKSGMNVDQYGEPSFNRHYDSSTQFKAAIDLVANDLKDAMIQQFSALDAPATAEQVVEIIRGLKMEYQ